MGAQAMIQEHLCECGCGQPTRLAANTNAKWGTVRGQPQRFVFGHQKRVPIEDRLWPRLKEDEHGCWIWPVTDRGGYGVIRLDGKVRRAHRVAYQLVVGVIPEGRHIDHLCRNRACCNPSHMEAVTPLENWRRGVGPAAVNARKTHCQHGHEFTPENTYIIPTTGSRVCRTCQADYKRSRAA